MGDKIPPQNIEAEQSVLGALLLDKEAIVKVVDALETRDFYQRSHQIIYETILHLFERQEPIDLVNVANRLKAVSKLEEAGGMGYLTTLVNAVSTPAHIASHAKIVHHKRVLRDLISVSYDISGLGYREDEDPDVLLDEAEQKIFSISKDAISQEFVSIKNALEEAFGRIERLHQDKGELRGVATGYTKLDNILGGLQRSDLIILASRPSLGKTSLALNIALNVATKKKLPVGIFSLEMSKEQVVDRFIATEAHVDLWKLRTGKLTDEGEYNDFMRIRDALASLSEAPIFIEDASSPNIMQIRAMARRLQAAHGLGLLVVDYLQLIQPRMSYESPVQAITEISRSLKALAKELNVPVLALSQLSRAVEQRTTRKPKLSDLRESGSIEQDADVVLFIYREDRDKEHTDRKNMADIMVAKHRNGPLGVAELYFNEQKASFENPSADFDNTPVPDVF
ncbi:replicative DNA helicase [Candidatus Azambacteria bacterium]|nr:replicative DNA helicase [Candidatus Azambacteria bacterium]